MEILKQLKQLNLSKIFFNDERSDRIRQYTEESLLKFLNKKVVYLLVSIVITVYMYITVSTLLTEPDLINAVNRTILISIIGVVASGLFVRNIVEKSVSFLLLFIPLIHILLGFITTFYYFPNLGVLIKFAAFVFLFIGLYVIMLITNIFFVIEEKGSVIPLYSVALAWLQIVIVSLAIPFYSGVYKIPSGFFLQNISLLVSVFLFNLYMIWGLSFDSRIIKTSWVEKLSLNLLLTFLVFVANFSMSFFPGESFLRAMFIASLLMFSTSYTQSHYLNRINKKLIIENTVVVVFFALLLAFFQP